MSEKKTYFSIVIPTRNEAEDIQKTLFSIRENNFWDYEVLVVDDSSDDTPQIVQKFNDPRFHLIRQDNRDGRCGARNQGILQAKGEVVVILNADVRLPHDFLEKVKKHYDKGVEYLVVDAKVENDGHPFGFMVEAIHQFVYRNGRETVDWCEGYSCLKRCVIKTGLFPVGYPVALCAGEDAVFAQNMAKYCKRGEDWDLAVVHRVPETWKGFWGTRSEKGRGIPMVRAWIENWSTGQILGESLKWLLKTFFWLILIFPWLLKCRHLGKAVKEPKLHWSRLIIPIVYDRIAHEIGRWQGVWIVLRA